MTPMHVTCPQCRAPLQLMIPSLPARASCPHCRFAFTLQSNPAAAPPGPPAAPAPARRRSPLVGVAVALVLLAALAGGGFALVKFCFTDNTPTRTEDYAAPPGGTATPVSQPADPIAAQRQLKVKQAIERGVAYLKTALDAKPFRTGYAVIGGSDLGVASFGALTLLECGVSPKDPVLVKVASSVRQNGRRYANTYSLSLMILLLDRLADPADSELTRDLALSLLAGQTTDGGWGYLCPVLSADDRTELLAALRGEGPLPKVAVPREGKETNSNTQFAVLGLWAARKHKVPAEQALARVAERFRRYQNDDGSWGYPKKSKIRRDSMTCAGLLAVAVGRGLDAAVKAGAAAGQDPAIDRGIRYLATALKRVRPVEEAEKQRRLKEAADLIELAARGPKFTLEERKEIKARNNATIKWHGALVDSEARGDLYFLWSVERVGVLYNLKTIGEVDWYAWGADILLANQAADGAWRERFPGIPDSCFALLFLRRANLIKDLTERLQGSLGLAADVGTRVPGGNAKGP